MLDGSQSLLSADELKKKFEGGGKKWCNSLSDRAQKPTIVVALLYLCAVKYTFHVDSKKAFTHSWHT